MGQAAVKLWLTVALVAPAFTNTDESFHVKYYDCAAPSGIKTVDLSTVCGQKGDNQPTNTGEVYTILTPRTSNILAGYECSMITSKFEFFCGAFSHMKLSSTPKIEIQEAVDYSSCVHAVVYGNYVDHYDNAKKVRIGTETVWTTSRHGIVSVKDGTVSCEGERVKINGGFVEGVVELVQVKFKITKEKFMVDTEDENANIKALVSRVRLPASCRPSAGYCEIPRGSTYYWKLEDDCPLMKVREVKLQNEGGLLVDHDNKLVFRKGQFNPFPAACGVGEFYFTEWDSLYLTQRDTSEFKVVNELHLGLYINARSDYVTYQGEKHFNSLLHNYHHSLCKAQYGGEHREEIFQLSEQGHFGKRSGDALYIFTCEVRLGEIAVKRKCYDHIPLMDGGYRDAITGLRTNHAVETDCNSVLPLTVKTEEGWVTINADGVQRAPRPNNISLLAEIQDGSAVGELRHENMAVGGLYTKTELANYGRVIEYGSFKRVTVENLVDGVCQGRAEDQCPNYNPSGHRARYSLDNLLQHTEEEVKKRTSWLDSFNKWLLRWGGLMSFVVLVKWTMDLVTTSVLVTMTFVRNGAEMAVHMVYTLLCGTIYRHRKMKRKMDKLEFQMRGATDSLRTNSYREFYDDLPRLVEEDLAVDRNNCLRPHTVTSTPDGQSGGHSEM